MKVCPPSRIVILLPNFRVCITPVITTEDAGIVWPNPTKLMDSLTIVDASSMIALGQ